MKVTNPLLVFCVRTGASYLLGARQPLAARRVVEWGLRREAGSADLWALRGRILLHTAPGGRGRRQDAVQLLEEARVSYARAAEIRPQDPEVRREHGLVLQNLAWLLAAEPGAPRGDLLEAAVQEYTRVLELQPRHADVLHARAMARAALRGGGGEEEVSAQLAAARADLDRSLELRPHAPEVVLHRAEVLDELATRQERAGNRPGALRLRRAALADTAWALRLRPGWIPALLRQAATATALAHAGDDPVTHADLAIAATRAILAAQPRHVPAMLASAHARAASACRLAAEGDARAALVWQQAVTDYDAAADAVGVRDREEIAALRAHARAQWAAALERGGAAPEALPSWEEALREYDRAVDDDPGALSRLLGRGQVLLRLAERAEDPAESTRLRRRALEDFAQVLTRRPDHPAALAGRVEAGCDPQGGAAGAREAVSLADQACSAHPQEPSVRAALRRALIALALAAGPGAERDRALARAERECVRALAADPGDALVHYDQARVLFLRGRAPAAYAALEQALHLSPGLRQTARRDPVWAPVAGGAGFRRLMDD